jgi:hypothetical protein
MAVLEVSLTWLSVGKGVREKRRTAERVVRDLSSWTP